MKKYNRREFIAFMGRNAALAALPGSLALRAYAARFDKYLSHSSEDSLRLANGLEYKILISWNDSINESDKFGNCNDFLAYFPFKENLNEGLLCVNHESPMPLFTSEYSDRALRKTKKQIEMEMKSVGVSVIHIKKTDTWNFVKDSKFNKRLDANSKIPFSQGHKILNESAAIGTLANCAGGKTPWDTFLTCEENYNDFYGEVSVENGQRVWHQQSAYQWNNGFDYAPENYGWVVEVQPTTAEAKKLIPLGRFAHEGATVTLAHDQRPVVYMGDDNEGEFIYKFIGHKKGSLESGDLFVANTKTGQWLPLIWEKNPEFKKTFKNQTDLLIRTREAARIAGATPQDRPEDIEVCPNTKAVYVSLTNNIGNLNFYGSILKIMEKNNDPLSLEFSSATFLTGGMNNGFACPDNLAFDPYGNLWFTTDMPNAGAKKIPYKSFKNSGLFFVPMSGKDVGVPYLVATGPVDAELTGPWFSPDGKTLFLSVQHPGEGTKDIQFPTSRWPGGKGTLPKSSVVAITGSFLDKLKNKI